MTSWPIRYAFLRNWTRLPVLGRIASGSASTRWSVSRWTPTCTQRRLCQWQALNRLRSNRNRPQRSGNRPRDCPASPASNGASWNGGNGSPSGEARGGIRPIPTPWMRLYVHWLIHGWPWVPVRIRAVPLQLWGLLCGRSYARKWSGVRLAADLRTRARQVPADQVDAGQCPQGVQRPDGSEAAAARWHEIGSPRVTPSSAQVVAARSEKQSSMPSE